MSELTKISYFDLKHENLAGRIPELVGFKKETDRLSRLLLRRLQHNAVITAPSGSGKTALALGWAKTASKNPLFKNKHIVMLSAPSLQKIGQLQQNYLNFYQEAFNTLQNTVLIIDSFGEMIYQNPPALQNWNTILKPLFFKDDISLILTMQPEELAWLNENKSHFLSHFVTLKLEVQNEEKLLKILSQSLEQFAGDVKTEAGVLELILKLCKRFPSLGQLPKSAIQLLDESLSESRGAQNGLSKAVVEKIAAEKTGIPLSQLNQDDKELLKKLPELLNSKIIGQTPALSKMISVIQRARLGLRTGSKPLGSFLVLGPSGVGKTETAKILAQTLYGSGKHFLRIDMSEFGQAHDTARLLGSPAGYVGYEEGGQMTNHFETYPYSLLLLDEIEKAHPKIFDIFLQILDDGRVTSAKGKVVDVTQSIIMATSNLAVEEIIEGANLKQNLNSDEFIKQQVVPKLLQHFRMEFLNRFDALVIFKPLTSEHLTDIALLEIEKIEKRMSEHKIKFSVSREILAKQLEKFVDPRFGARPVKRFVEGVCEELISKQLLA